MPPKTVVIYGERDKTFVIIDASKNDSNSSVSVSSDFNSLNSDVQMHSVTTGGDEYASVRVSDETPTGDEYASVRYTPTSGTVKITPGDDFSTTRITPGGEEDDYTSVRITPDSQEFSSVRFAADEPPSELRRSGEQKRARVPSPGREDNKRPRAASPTRRKERDPVKRKAGVFPQQDSADQRAGTRDFGTQTEPLSLYVPFDLICA